jgi:small subunit ribosomal protein S6
MHRMPLYEHVYIARQDISPQQVDALTEQFKTVIAGLGGTVGKTEYWGLKNFSYRMKRYRKGHYVLMNVDAPGDALKELERQERIHEDVLRYLTIRVESLETEPSAQMQRGRDDRGDRGDRGGGFGGGGRGGFGGDRGGFGGGGGRGGFGDRDRDRGSFGDRDRDRGPPRGRPEGDAGPSPSTEGGV